MNGTDARLMLEYAIKEIREARQQIQTRSHDLDKEYYKGRRDALIEIVGAYVDLSAWRDDGPKQ